MNTKTQETPSTLGPELTELIEVRALAVFNLGERRVEVGDLVLLPYHRASYAQFLGLVVFV